MMFTALIDTLRDRGRGIHGYSALAEAAYENARSGPEAAAYYMLAKQADDFVEFTERMPVPAREIDAMFDRISANAKALDAAFAGGDKAAVLDVLNSIAHEAAAMRSTA
ncbi:hypothetical protein [Roseicitreum antarcticum]|uniref:Uncharacterized protein n=1 Tax=Roseicitreum antarcticum TaxID=564137 RepID=A0A1H2YSF1_9RHOB|nr:hypothetical protein [Roseicitreum antarcticum]SDX07614.1 hypothetical protein SAMN04488238_105102 [Roseicitreum antarcticum]